MKFLLIGYNVWRVVNNNLIKPESILNKEMMMILNPEYSGWIKNNNKTMSVIALNVSSEVVIMIVNFNTAKRMWDYLFSQYQPHGFNLKYTLLICLFNLQLEFYTSVNDYVLKYWTLLLKIMFFKLIVDQTFKVIFFLNNLSDFYT